MSKNIYFKETQSFSKKLPAIIVLILSILWIFAIVWQIFLGHSFGPYPINNLGLILMGIILLSPFILMLFLKMETQVKDDGLFYKLKPIEFSWHKIPATKILSSKIIKNEKKGKTALVIKLENKKSISIISEKAEELQIALNKIL